MITKSELEMPGLKEYYPIWLKNCKESFDYCLSKGNINLAEEYAEKAQIYADLIRETNEHKVKNKI